MTIKEMEDSRRSFLDRFCPYRLIFYEDFDYGFLNHIVYKRKPMPDSPTINDCFIMGDTETSKKPEIWKVIETKGNRTEVHQNHVVAWTISIRAVGRNVVTLYGRKPSEFCECVGRILDTLPGEQTIIYFHNLAYDYVFLRKFLFLAFGHPVHELNTKPHYPVALEFENGLILKDSLILAQRSIEKWAKDLNVEHQKAVGKWDYDRIRNQDEYFTPDELEYIEHDTLAGVECLDALRIALKKSVYSMPYTATGIPREDVKKRGSKEHANKFFKRHVMDFGLYKMSENVYHGGFTHANRHEVGFIQDKAISKDFASSYPFQMLAKKYPMGGFNPISDKKIDFILENADQYAFMFKLILLRPRLKNDLIPMPVLQFSKCVKIINAVIDNGRVLRAEYAEIFLNEIDLQILADQYEFDNHICLNVYAAAKDYLPRWLTDYVFQLYEDKTKLKGGDPVLYALAKSKLNSVYGMCVQKCIRQEIVEDFETGDYTVSVAKTDEELYNEYVLQRKNVLLYQWGIWITSYAMKCLFDLGECVSGTWLYSDTDSIYATEWDEEKVRDYNEGVKRQLLANGYGPVVHNGREYWIGAAEPDSVYTEFITLGSKRYAGRCDGKLKITVAGVPKKGAACLNDDLRNFRRGMIFDGKTTGKLLHVYIYTDGITIDENGNETGDSIDLNPCNYLLDQTDVVTWDDLFTDEILIEYYEEGDFQ